VHRGERGACDGKERSQRETYSSHGKEMLRKRDPASGGFMRGTSRHFDLADG